MSQNFSIETKVKILFLILYFNLLKKRNGTLGTRDLRQYGSKYKDCSPNIAKLYKAHQKTLR